MNNLIIEQSLSSVESINATIIEKLYELAKTSKVQNANYTFTMSLKGNVSTPSAYEDSVTYLRLKFPELIITVQDNNYYIRFKDSKVEEALVNAGIGDSLGVPVATAANANIGTALRGNTEITSFDEFRYFTKANTNPVDNMFNGCTNLANINLSEITTFPYLFLYNTAIQTLSAPNLISFSGYLSGAGAVSHCAQLTQVLNLGHVSVIPNGTFAGCANLLSVVLPLECVSLGNDSFAPLTNTVGILSEIDGIDNVTTFGTRCFKSLTSLRLGPNDLKNAQAISGEAFWYVPISSINCKNLISLGKSAFRENLALTAVECLGTISTIPEFCFASDSNLQTAKLPYECTSIGGSAFSGCSALTSVTLYNKSINEYEEGEEPDYMPNLSKISFFKDSCFKNCQLLVFTNSDILNAIEIGNFGFFKTKLLGAITLNNIQILNTSALEQTLITSLDLSNSSITNAPLSMVYGCTNLQSVNLPSTCKEIKNSVFKNCTNLETISGLSGNVSIGSEAFYGCNKLSPTSINNIAITLSGNENFAYCYLLTEITLLQTPIIINSAFINCSSLTTINNSEYITELNGKAFNGCSSLTSLNLDDSNISITGRPFRECSSLTTLGKYDFTFNGIVKLIDHFFYNCTNLEGSFTFPDCTSFDTSDYGGQFNGASKITKLSFPLIQTIDTGSRYYQDIRSAFGRCSNLKIVDFGNLLSLLASFNFYECNSLRAIIINNTSVPFTGKNGNREDILLTKMFGNNSVNIYVPDSAVDTYKATLPYSNFPDNIKPISTYNESLILGS